MMQHKMPSALRLAARSNADPKWLGEILLALYGQYEPKKLDKAQGIVYQLCLEEEAEQTERRASAAERKRRSRERARKGNGK